MKPVSTSAARPPSGWNDAERAKTLLFCVSLWGPVLVSCSDSAPQETASSNGGGAVGDDLPHPDSPPRLVVAPDQLEETQYAWDLPAGFRRPWEPVENPTTSAKVKLGRHLFYDERLSGNGTQSCASCHRQELAFTDGRKKSVGSTGEEHPRSSMSLANIGYASSLTWGNPLLTHLERQALTPLFGTEPIEMGLKDQREVPGILEKVPAYAELFEEAFPDDEQHYTIAQITKALAAFQRTLISGDSPFDRWAQGDEQALRESAKSGYALFHSEKFECFHCHGTAYFSDHTHYAGKPFFEAPYHNTGLYHLDEAGSYPAPNYGIYAVTLEATHMGRHKAPTLRNIAVTAPYMHDGSIATLEEVLDHYAAGGRTILHGPLRGVGADNPQKDGLIRPISMTREERAAVIAFLESLTDEGFLKNPAYSNPW